MNFYDYIKKFEDKLDEFSKKLPYLFLFFQSNKRIPLVDIEKKNDELSIYIEIPGIKKEDIKLEVFEHLIKIKGKIKQKKGKFILKERQFKEYEREILLPEQIDISTINTKLEDGILILNAKIKKLSGKSKKIKLR